MATAKLHNGSIEYVSATETIPASSKTEGNVTINQSEIQGTPAHFEVRHFIAATSEQDGMTCSNSFSWKTLVPAASPELPYHHVEDAAAHQIAAALRDLADAIEREVKLADDRRTENTSG